MADIRINALPTTATDFASDDYIAIDGTTNGTRKLNAKTANLTFSDVTLGTSGPSVKSTLSARAPRQGLVFDGTGGAPTFTAASIGSVDFTAAAFITATSFGSNGRVILNGTNFEFGLLNTGAIYIYNGTTVLSSTGTLTAGKSTLVTYTKSGTSGTFYINGVSAGTVTDSLTYGSVSGVGGANSVSGMLGTIAPYLENRALSASEVVALYEAGAPAGADYATPAATNTNQITGDAWWNTSTGSVSSGTITLTSGQYVLRGAVLTKGKRYRTTYNVTALTGIVQVGNTSAAPSVVQNVSLGAGSFEFTANDNGAFGFNASAGTATINSVTFVPVGLLLAPDATQAGGGLTWYDTSGNAANITLPASGVSWNVPTSGNLAGNLQVNGTGNNVFRGPIRWGNTAYPGYNGYITETNTASQLIPAITRNLIGTTGNTQYTIANAELGAYAAFELGTDIRWFAGSGTFTTGQTITPTELMRLTQGGNLLLGTTTDGGQKLQVNGTAAISSTLTVAGTILSVNTGLFSADATLSSYSTSNGVYLNGHAAGWLRLAGSGGGGAAIQLNGGTGSGATIVFTTNNSTTALTLDSSQNATFAGTGTSSFAGNLNIKGALGAHQTAALNLAYEGSSVSQLVAYGADASTLGRVNIVLRKAGTGTDAVAGLSVRDFGIITQGGVAQTPASASATGAAGTIQWDASYIYICTATNTWKRVAIATW